MEFEVLNILNSNGFEAYIVGGYVRDFMLHKNTDDIDITTNAKPYVIKKLFDVVSENYGSLKVNYEGKAYEITTYRKERFYINHRHPKQVKFVKDIKKDLKRRDFTINALIMDKDKNIIDYVEGLKDLENQKIKVIGNTRRKIKQDPLRILRAIRFATILNFKLDLKLKKCIKKYGYMLNYLSMDRKKEELDKIFSSPNLSCGINLIKELDLSKHLNISRLDDIIYVPNVNYIWAQIDFSNYNFSKKDYRDIRLINNCLNLDILDSFNLYHYGIDAISNVAKIKHINEDKVKDAYEALPIKNRSEIKYDLSTLDSDTIKKIEYQIIIGNLKNKKSEIKKFINDI